MHPVWRLGSSRVVLGCTLQATDLRKEIGQIIFSLGGSPHDVISMDLQ
jgi:hypothetical protein